MKIAVASGKGGTGKTTVSTSLARSLIEYGKVCFCDCDAEAPNSHFFLKPVISDRVDAVIPIPQIQKDLCTACGKCVKACQFHALAKIGSNIILFEQLCHGCGCCSYVCPENAILEIPHVIGSLENGLTDEGIEFYRGVLSISEPMATPIIRQIKKRIPITSDSIYIYDSPPGASCSVVETVRGSDYALLVTEPTRFGLHDLKQMLTLLREMNIPHGVIINRDGLGGSVLDQFCEEENLKVLLRIPFDRRIAEGIARGKSLLEIDPQYSQIFKDVFTKIQNEGACRS